MRSPLRLVVLAPLLALGCNSGPRVAPVSGRVTMDNKPLPGAKVTFQPIATEGNNYPGVGSYGVTDGEGNYTLKLVDNDRPGAVVAEHRVEITLSGDLPKPDDDRTRMDTGKVPRRYNLDSTLRRTVPPEGTKEMNFELTSNK
jgi:hypothetical protein